MALALQDGDLGAGQHLCQRIDGLAMVERGAVADEQLDGNLDHA